MRLSSYFCLVLYFYILFWYCCVALYVDCFFSHSITAGVLEPFSPLAIFTPEKWLYSHLFPLPYQGGKWIKIQHKTKIGGQTLWCGSKPTQQNQSQRY
jgi:hypothetical protein